MEGLCMVEIIQPLYDRVLVERIENEAKTASGIIIPDVAQEKAQMGKVKAIGGGRLMSNGTIVPLIVKIGDTVFFGKYAGTEAGANGLIVKEDEILGIVK